jgi:hypothetical protein
MAKTNEDRLQEAIEDALDGRAILMFEDWRHPISGAQALSVLIRRKQNEAFFKGVEARIEYELNEGAFELKNPYNEENHGN